MVGTRSHSTGVLAIAVANLPPDLRYEHLNNLECLYEPIVLDGTPKT